MVLFITFHIECNILLLYILNVSSLNEYVGDRTTSNTTRVKGNLIMKVPMLIKTISNDRSATKKYDPPLAQHGKNAAKPTEKALFLLATGFTNCRNLVNFAEYNFYYRL